MRRLLPPLIAIAFLLLPSGSQAQTSTEPVKADTQPGQVVTARVKKPFSKRHPKVYKSFRKVRTICIFISPVVNVGSNLATAIGVIF